MRKISVSLLTALFFFLFTTIANGQIAITVTGNTNTTPNLQASYTSLASALTDLNAVTAMTGPVVLTCTAGGSETVPATGLTIGSATLNPVLSSTNTITINKSGGTVTLNAGVGTATPGSAAPDGILKLVGADYVTIDGLTFTDGNTTNPASMEFGIGMFKLNAGDGCNNNTIQNCTFNMQRVNNASGTTPMLDGSVAIEVVNSTPSAATTSLTPTNGGTLATNGTNSGNKFYTNTINGGNIGIGFGGYAATLGVGPSPNPATFLGDLGNDIGGTSAGTGNTILNYGGGGTTNPAAGIRLNNEWSANVQYNTVNNNNGSGVNHATTLRGIYGQAGTSANATISNNTITVKSGATTSSLIGIDNSIGTTAAANTVNITGNTIQNCTYATGTTGTFSAISNSSNTAATLNISSNIIQNNSYSGAITTATWNGIINSSSNTNFNCNNNQIINNSVGTSTSANSCTIQLIYSSGSSTNFTANSNTLTGNTLANQFGTIYGIRAGTSVLSYDGNTIANNTIPNSAGATSSSIYGFYDGSSPVTENYTNNNINNLTISGTSTATSHVIYGIYILTASGVKTISGNNINNLSFTSSGAGYSTVVGINDAYASTGNIFKNVVHSLSSTGVTPTVRGISFGTSAGTTYNVYNNLVGNLTAPASTGFNLVGIYCGSVGTTYNVSYNTVYLNATSSASGSATSALYMSSTTPTVNLIDNILVNISTGTTSWTTTALRRTSTTLTAYGTSSNNNLFYAGTPSATNLIYYDGTNSYQTMSAFKTAVSPRESASFTEGGSSSYYSTAGTFFQSVTGPSTGTSTTFLHLVNGLTTQCESGGITVSGITTDFDGDTRNVTTPDVGADEFNGTPQDLTPPVISYTALGNACSPGSRTLTATITDASGVPTSGAGLPVLYWKIGAGSYTAATATYLGSNQYQFTLGTGSVTGDQISYYIVAQDNASTPNVGAFPSAGASGFSTNPPAASTPPTTPSTYTNSAQLTAGTYTVGSGGAYATLTAAVADYNAKAPTGAVIFSLTDATYPSETFPITINNNSCASASNTLTIQPASGVAATITGGSSSVALIKLLNAKYVTIDGLNSGGSSLTLTNTNTGTSANIWLASTTSTGPGNNNITIQNLTLNGGSNTATSDFGIVAGVDGASPSTTGGPDNDNITISNNTILKTYYGIYANGTASVSTGGLDNLTISNNTVGPVSSGANNIGFAGINVGNAISPTINSNTIQNMSATTAGAGGIITASTVTNASINLNTIQNLSTTTPALYGILVAGASGGSFSVSRNIVSNITGGTGGSSYVAGIEVSSASPTTIDRNKISNIINNSTSTYGAYGINLSANNNHVVKNNFVSNVSGDMTGGGAFSTTFGLFGIRIGAGTGHQIYHNSVNLYGARTGTATSSLLGAAFCIVSTTSTGCDVRNNIFSNTITGGTTSVAYTSVYLPTSGTTAMNLTWNNNAYYTGTTAGVHGVAHVGTTYTSPPSGPTTYAGLYDVANFNPATTTGTSNFRSYTSNLLTANTNNDNASYGFTTAAPFITNTDLHIPNGTSGQLESGGASVGVTTDIDGQVRPGPAGSVNGGASAPDIGADEFDGVPAQNMAYVSSTTTQTNTSAVSLNSTNNHIIGIQIVVSGTLNPLQATSFTISTNGTTNVADITNAKLWYTGNSSTFATTTQVGSTVGAPSGSFSITGSQTLSTGTNYFWLTYDVPCGATIGNTIDAECTSITVGSAQTPSVTNPGSGRLIANAGLTGTKTIGASGDYTSLTGSSGIFAAINANGLSGNLVINITDANVTETGTVALNTVNYNCAGPYTITIKPNTSSTLGGSVASGALIKLNGASRVTIDGSNSGGTDRSLSIINTATTAPTAVAIVSTGAGTTNNTIKNCNISTGIATTLGYGISVGGSTPGTSGADNDNVTIQNNNITIVPIGIYANGTASVSAGGNDNLTINGNTIDYNGTLASLGIQVANSLNSSVNQNTVSEQTTAAQSPTAISLETGFVSSTVTKNMITKCVTTNTGGYGGRGITVGTGTATSNLTIANNVIYGVNGSNWTGFSNSSSIGIGIGMVGSSSTITTTAGGINIYYNSVNMYGNYVGTSTTTGKITAALYVGSGATAMDIRDNVFVNSMNNTTATATNYAVYSAAANTAFTSINYNDYFVSGSQGVLGFLSTNQATLVAWQTATAQDANSINGDPLFASNTNLQPSTGSPVGSAGTPIAGITTDITGYTRNASTPTIGAYEQTGDFTGPTITYSLLGNTLCNGNRTLSATITDPSGVNGTSGTRPRVYYKKASNANVLGATNDNTTDGWKYAEASNSSSPFNLTLDMTLINGGVGSGDVIQYFVVAQDNAGTPNVGIYSGTFNAQPSSVALTSGAFPIGGTINSYTIQSGGIGTDVYIGATGDYQTLTGAGGLFAALNAGGLTGNINVLLKDATINETGAVTLNSINYGCSGPYTLKIFPATGPVTLTGNSTTALIKLNGSDYVTIDGSVGGTGTDKSLTITNTNTATSGNAVIWLASSSASDGATNNTIKNCIITGNASTTTQMGIFSGGTASISTSGNALSPNSNNTIQNNTISKSQFGIYVIGVGTSTLGTGLTITGNTLGSSTAGDGFTAAGILTKFQANATISGNDVQNIVGTSGFSNLSGSTVMAGIHLESVTSSTISANKIHFMNYNGSSVNKVYGLNTETSTFNVIGNQSANTFVNNIVYDLVSSGTSSSWNTSGINNNGGYNDKYYYNSVYLTGQMSNTGTAGSAAFSNGNGISSTNCPVIDVRNNIFNMKGSSNAAAKLYAHYTTLTTYSGSTLNYNDLISQASGSATAVLGFFNSADRANLAAWQTATGQEANSISADPLFNSNTNLQPQLGSPVVAAGVSIGGVTTDITGASRNNPPTIGAYETAAGDFSGPVISYSLLGNICSTSNRPFTNVTITDASGVNTTSGTRPRVYYKRTIDANTVNDNTNGTNGWKYTEANGTSSPFDFTIDYSLLYSTPHSGVIAGDTVQYFVVAQDLQGTPLVSINSGTFTSQPSSVALTAAAFPIGGSIRNYTIGSNLSGTKTVGSGGDYATLTAATAAYNAACLTGPVTFSLLDASYTTRTEGTGETFPIVINSNSYANSTNTLTIKPASGASVNISGSSASSIIKLNGADYVIIDGSNNGSTSRNMTIANTTTATSTGVIWLSSASATDGATNNVIKNVIVNGNSSTTTGYGIITGGASIPSNALTSNSNNVFQNNFISMVQLGMNIQGASATTLDAGTQVLSNALGSSTAGDGFSVLGIQTQFQDGIIIRGNEVQNIVNTSTSGANHYGIALLDGKNAVVEKNKIHMMSYTGTSTNKLFGIITQTGNFNTSGSPSNNTIRNNVVYDLTSSSTSGFWSLSGIDEEGGYGDKFYFNSVYLTGSLSGATTAPAACFANGNTFNGSPCTTIDVRDNIFYMNGSTSVATPMYAHYTAATSNTGFTLNYNDLLSVVTGSAIANIGRFNSTDYTTLSAWQTASGEGANSISADPLFTSATNLNPQITSPVIGAGVSIGTVTTDITGSTRNSNPTMGAYENRIIVSAKMYLQGAYNSGLLRHKDVSANWANVLNANATSQPYSGAPWNYTGTESVSNGFFTSNSGVTTDIVDWVLIELRDANTPTTIVATRAAFVREDGLIVDVDGTSPVSFRGFTAGNYFVAIRHRNHLGVRTSSVQLVDGSSSPVPYDFTTAQSQAYQAGTSNTAMKDFGNGQFGLWAGNVNANTNVRYAGPSNDNSALLTIVGGNTTTVLSNVYSLGDLNMDGTVRYSGPSNDNSFLLGILGGNTTTVLTQNL